MQELSKNSVFLDKLIVCSDCEPQVFQVVRDYHGKERVANSVCNTKCSDFQEC